MAAFTTRQSGPSVLQGLALGGASGIAQSLQQLAAERLANIRKQNEQRDFASAILGQKAPSGASYTPEQANFIAMQRPEDRLKVYGMLSPGNIPQEPQAAVPEATIQEPTEYARAQKERFQELEPEEPESVQQGIKEPTAQELMRESNLLQAKLPSELKVQDIVKAAKQFNYPVDKETMDNFKEMAKEYNAAQKQPQVAKRKTPTAEELLRPNPNAIFNAPTSRMEQLRAQEVASKLREEQRALEEAPGERRRKSFKDADKNITEIVESAEAASDMRAKIKDLERLYESGKMDAPSLINFYRDMGWPVDELQNPYTAEAQNIIKSFIATGPKMFGGKVTEGEMNVLLSAFPAVTSDPKGALFMLATMDKYAARAEAKEKALDRMVDDNDGELPAGYQLKIKHYAKPYYEQAEKDYTKKIARIEKLKLAKTHPGEVVLAKTYGKLGGALGEGVQKAARNAPSALTGAAIGGLIGGPVGAGVGAGAGILQNLAQDFLSKQH